MVFEDLFIAGYLVLLNALITQGPETHLGAVGLQLLAAALFVGLLFVLSQRFQESVERLLNHRSEEAFTLVLFAFVLLTAAIAILVGVSEAVGAFLAGIVIGATRLRKRAASTLLPFQTLFAALFFVSFGMGLRLDRIPSTLPLAIILTVLGLATKGIGGYLAGRWAGHSSAQSATIGISLVPKGEFSIVIAALAGTVASPGSDIQTLSALYVFALSIIGPIGMREADRIGKLFIHPSPPPTRTG